MTKRKPHFFGQPYRNRIDVCATNTNQVVYRHYKLARLIRSWRYDLHQSSAVKNLILARLHRYNHQPLWDMFLDAIDFES